MTKEISTSSGSRVKTANRVIEIEEVFDAIIEFLFRIEQSLFMISVLTVSFSVAASITKSQSVKSLKSVLVEIRDTISFFSNASN